MTFFHEDAPRIFTCAGPPWCDYNGKGNPTERQKDCLFCTVEKVDTLGVWHVIRKPSQC